MEDWREVGRIVCQRESSPCFQLQGPTLGLESQSLYLVLPSQERLLTSIPFLSKFSNLFYILNFHFDLHQNAFDLNGHLDNKSICSRGIGSTAFQIYDMNELCMFP